MLGGIAELAVSTITKAPPLDANSLRGAIATLGGAVGLSVNGALDVFTILGNRKRNAKRE